MDERSLIQQKRLLSQHRQQVYLEQTDETLPITAFFETSPYKQFLECCDLCRRFRYVGICYGPAGVGKTIAARLYAGWDAVEPLLERRGVRMPVQGAAPLYPQVALYTPAPLTKPKQIESDVAMLLWSLQHLDKIALHQYLEMGAVDETPVSEQVELLIIDNVHQLNPVCMDVVQGMYDRYRIGVVLLGDARAGRKAFEAPGTSACPCGGCPSVFCAEPGGSSSDDSRSLVANPTGLDDGGIDAGTGDRRCL